MITVDKSMVYEVDLSSGLPAIINYDANGMWSQPTTKSVDYTAKKPVLIEQDAAEHHKADKHHY
jgi:hypothetical protein